MSRKTLKTIATLALATGLTACAYGPETSSRYGAWGAASPAPVGCDMRLQPCGYVEQFVRVDTVVPVQTYQMETVCCEAPPPPPPVYEPPVVEPPVVVAPPPPPEPPVYEPPVYVPPPAPEPPIVIPPLRYPDPVDPPEVYIPRK